MEVVGLKKKIEKSNVHVKFTNSSVILDEILDSQRPTFDKYVLCNNKAKEKSEVGTWSPETPKVSSSMTKSESETPPHVPAHDNKELRRSSMHQGVIFAPPSKSRRETTSRWNPSPRYEIDSMAIVFLALILVIRLWSVDPMEEEVLESRMKKLHVGHVIILAILLLIVT